MARAGLVEPGPLTDPLFVVKNVNIQLVQVIVVATTASLMVALTLLVAKARIGKATFFLNG